MHPGEPHALGSAQRLNRLRAGVLGANDGIVSVAALVVGVAGATTASATILTAGAAGLVGGAISMALGEYVSVSSQRDSEQAMIAEERRELQQHPDGRARRTRPALRREGAQPDDRAAGGRAAHGQGPSSQRT